MAGKIFINYRRDDSAPHALNVAQYLENTFGKHNIFIDIDRLRAGLKFRTVLEDKLAQCKVMLAIIGPNWVDARDGGSRRIDNPEDWVRVEIERALARDIPVIPVLVAGATLPSKSDLPPSLQPLLKHQGATLTTNGFRYEMAGLARDVADLTVRRPWGRIAAAASALILVGYVIAHQLGVPVWWPSFGLGQPNLLEGPSKPSAKSEADSAAKRNADAGEAARDPALSVMPGSGKTFQDRLADGKPCPMCPEMVVVPAGKFTMGSPVKEDGRTGYAETQFPVTISQPFAVAKFAVTFDQWDACVADGSCYRPADEGWGRGKLPVINVNWANANVYAEWLSQKTGRTYSLLSEAEREYVTRAGTNTPFWWGSSIAPKQANYNDNLTYGGGPTGKFRGRTVPVGEFEANPWGLFNVHGNVMEWTTDCWTISNLGNGGSARTTSDPLPLPVPAHRSPNCSKRVIRGGSWKDDPKFLRAAFRYGYTAGDRDSYIGFRLARTLNP
jgi:formylglycine-generating enzyme required for sulfatase activity